MGPVSKIVAVCLSAVVLAGGIALSAAARGGYSDGDSGNHQYGSKPACEQFEKDKHGKKSARYDHVKDCPR